MASFLTEIEHRQMASRAGVPVPTSNEWMPISLVVRTVHSKARPSIGCRVRASNPASRNAAIQRSCRWSIRRSSRFSRRVLRRLATRFQACSSSSLRSRATTQRLDDAARPIVGSQVGVSEVVCSQTHGDFQPGNVLLDGMTSGSLIGNMRAAGWPFTIPWSWVWRLDSRSAWPTESVDFIEHGPTPTRGHWPAVGRRSSGTTASNEPVGGVLPLRRAHFARGRKRKPPITTAGHGLHEMLRQVERFLELTESR